MGAIRQNTNPDMPKEMERIICDCWDPNPAGRPTIDEVIQRILKIQYVMEEQRRDMPFSENTRQFRMERREEFLGRLVAEETDGSYIGDISQLYAQCHYFTHKQLTA